MIKSNEWGNMSIKQITNLQCKDRYFCVFNNIYEKNVITN